jgi:hypothetical protein
MSQLTKEEKIAKINDCFIEACPICRSPFPDPAGECRCSYYMSYRITIIEPFRLKEVLLSLI